MAVLRVAVESVLGASLGAPPARRVVEHANATCAILLPRRCLMRSAHALNAAESARFDRRTPRLACTSKLRSIVDPVLVMDVGCLESTELCSPGTSPK